MLYQFRIYTYTYDPRTRIVYVNNYKLNCIFRLFIILNEKLTQLFVQFRITI